MELEKQTRGGQKLVPFPVGDGRPLEDGKQGRGIRCMLAVKNGGSVKHGSASDKGQIGGPQKLLQFARQDGRVLN